jgi:hypothetical protein
LRRVRPITVRGLAWPSYGDEGAIVTYHEHESTVTQHAWSKVTIAPRLLNSRSSPVYIQQYNSNKYAGQFVLSM